jgi:hypothetical protein
MKFTAKGANYVIDQFGVVHQLNPEPYVYDETYASTYDTPEYKTKSDILQAIRLGFISAAHGDFINSLIDVGFGNGAFMKFAKQHIKLVAGIDVTAVNVPDGCYKLDKFEPADVVTFHDCLEHIPDLMFVRDIPAKTIVISLPYCHISDKGLTWFENEYPHLKKNEHLHHFDEQSLIRFMDNMGWYCTAVSTHEDIIRKRPIDKNILSAAFKRKQEVWLPVKDWEGKYEVSSFGRVKSLSRKIGGGSGYYSKERILIQQSDKDGYRQISFPIANRKNVTVRVHHLVANAFVSNPENKPFVNHKNGVRWHNYATNIEWSTPRENVLHGFHCNGREVENVTTRKPIKQMTLTREFVKEWESGLLMEKEGGFNRSAVAKAIREKKPYYGFYWEYV